MKIQEALKFVKFPITDHVYDNLEGLYTESGYLSPLKTWDEVFTLFKVNDEDKKDIIVDINPTFGVQIFKESILVVINIGLPNDIRSYDEKTIPHATVYYRYYRDENTKKEKKVYVYLYFLKRNHLKEVK